MTAESVGDHINILIAGELNSGTSPRLESEVRKLIVQGNARIVVSLENVSLVTSAGLRVLLVLAKEIRKIGGNIALYDCSSNVLEIFRMTGFDTILSLCAGYEEAVLAVGATLSAYDETSFEFAKPTFH